MYGVCQVTQSLKNQDEEMSVLRPKLMPSPGFVAEQVSTHESL